MIWCNMDNKGKHIWIGILNFGFLFIRKKNPKETCVEYGCDCVRLRSNRSAWIVHGEPAQTHENP